MLMYPDPKRFCYALRAWIEQSGHFHKWIAEQSGINRFTLNTYTRKNGTNYSLPTLGNMIRLAKVFGVTLDELACGPNGEGLEVSDEWSEE